MSDDDNVPLLDLHSALVEFPRECATVLDPDGWSGYEVTEFDGLHGPPACGEKTIVIPPHYGQSGSTTKTIHLRESDLIAAAVRWLADRPGPIFPEDWPRDMLRWFLEDVKDMLEDMEWLQPACTAKRSQGLTLPNKRSRKGKK